MTDKIYATLWEACCDMRAQAILHHSKIVTDNDVKRGLLGWKCVETEDHFYVRLADIKRRTALELPSLQLSFENHKLQQLLTDFIRNPIDRERLANILSWGGEENELHSTLSLLERAYKLKVFW